VNDLKRRVQHYGWRYDYSSRVVTEEMKTEPLPDFILGIARELKGRGWFASVPDQVIVNEYEPGQGIAPHIDRDCFGPSVATLSLGDRWPMQFIPLSRSAVAAESEEIFLDVGSMLVLRGNARTEWMHGIVKRRTDGQGRSRRQRMRRVSVTFRPVELRPRRL
jgi:alkylated DNA repair dioxygenase AlkB